MRSLQSLNHLMIIRHRNLYVCLTALLLIATSVAQSQSEQSSQPREIFGFRSSAAQVELERRFMAVPDRKLAEEHMRILTKAPHIAGSREDKETADYVARKFREAGLATEILEYKVWLDHPQEISVRITAPKGVTMQGPSRERVDGDPFQDDARVLGAFNGSSPSGDVEAEVIYANYGRLEDFARLDELNIDVRGKIVLVRYGENYRGDKSHAAEQRGAAGVIIYSDPMDDGYFRGDVYPKGPWLPETGVQRGTIHYGVKRAGDPSTPGFPSLPSTPDSMRIPPSEMIDMPRIPTLPLSWKDARPILENLAGPSVPTGWQGALPFAYHIGPGPVRVKMRIKSDFRLRTIWNVIGKVRGTEFPEEQVIAGNHRDAWVYGAVDPVSGTTMMLETVHGIGELLKSGWRPKRTIIFASWDAEEQGLIGSTEWVEHHQKELAKAVAYFNTDTGAAGPNFRASAVPSLNRLLRETTRDVPSPRGGTVYDNWVKQQPRTPLSGGADAEPRIGVMGNGSDYTAFIDHLGVPATDIRSTATASGIYHSVFDNFAWFKKFGDTDFTYTQQMSRIFGLQLLRTAQADVLPLDYATYAAEILRFVAEAERRATSKFGKTAIDFGALKDAAGEYEKAARAITHEIANPNADAATLNSVLLRAERAFLIPEGLPGRAWYRHAIFAPAEFSSYASTALPGINDAVSVGDLRLAQQQVGVLTRTLTSAAELLRSYFAAKPETGS
ncbi:MAG TPA: M28 family metallopeptidase [Terriglobales bacterium]|nr:M28 family metallopeptidase [Terriglobales bacterium]